MDRATLDGYISTWLGRAHRDGPEAARIEWDTQGVALLELGQRFSAVRIPERFVQAALGSTDLDEIAELLATRFQGPVVRDSLAVGVPYYALVQWHSGIVWDGAEDMPCLGDGTHMGVPRLDRLSPPGTYWLVPPRYDGDLCRPERVQQLTQHARAAAAEKAEP
ncbi:hypothetical protein ACKI1J_43200 [Streptomyces scabiei]|uniref:hypothetical protein n=1 Tax=Streptomyces TaxID=1883 RepID=UPI0029BA19CB|nr:MULTISPECIES: hypothetical protein [Streptomyces]MDX2552626.1 hypothetical protein [Streptomyces stelliscabiei]MDX3028117.1 hypothetical protein [Streptomyces scabiei]